MQNENKLIKKYVRPYYLAAYGSVALFALTIFASYKVVSSREPGTISIYADGTEEIMNILSLIVLVIAIYACKYGWYTLPNKADEFASDTAYNYLSKLIEEIPELKMCASILHKPQQMQNIATFISNSLTDAEQQEILQIVKDLKDEKLKQKHGYCLTSIVIGKVTDVIKRHEQNNPGFVKELMSVIKKPVAVYAAQNQRGSR